MAQGTCMPERINGYLDKNSGSLQILVLLLGDKRFIFASKLEV